jgi:prophage regulatory protein
MGAGNSSRNRFRSTVESASLLREWQVLGLLPISRSSLWAGVRSGRFPKPVKLGPNTTAWRASDIFAFIESLGSKPKRPAKRRTATARERHER